MSSDNESALSRWSRRKHEARQQPETIGDIELDPEITQTLAETDQPCDTESAPETDINSLCDEDMPDLDNLTEDSDFSGFLSRNVSAALRKQALRKLFTADSFNLRDGLDEYDGDYTSFKKLDPSVITADLRHRMELEAKEKMQEIAEETIDPETLDTAAAAPPAPDGDDTAPEHDSNEQQPEVADTDTRQEREKENLA